MKYFKELSFLFALLFIGISINQNRYFDWVILLALGCFVVYILTDKEDSESSSDNKDSSNFTEIENVFIDEVMNYAYNIGLNARIFVEGGILQLQNEVEKDRFENIGPLVIPREAKSVKDTVYKRNFEEMKSAMDDYKEKLEN